MCIKAFVKIEYIKFSINLVNVDNIETLGKLCYTEYLRIILFIKNLSNWSVKYSIIFYFTKMIYKNFLS